MPAATVRTTAGLLSTCLAIGALLALPALCADPNWMLLDDGDESSFFYDRNGTGKVRDGMVQVRTRVVYTEEGKKEALKVLTGLPEPAKLYESRYMYEIDCVEKEGRLLAATHFDAKGGILRSTDLTAVTVPEYLPPGSRMALVAEEACAP